VRTFQFHRKARADYKQALAFYLGEGDEAGWAFAVEIREAFDLILTFPAASPADRYGVRRKPLRNFPYSIFYIERGETIEITAIIHQKRSEFWRDRL
jgi:plasmid stabilization system protein ParE